MFSTAQMDIMRGLISEMRAQGYNYYIAYQNQLTGVTNDYDLFMYFSTTEIYADDMFSYYIPKGSLKYSIRSGNVSQYYSGNRLTVDTVNTAIVDMSILSYNHISTNARFTTQFIQPDLFPEVTSYQSSSGVLFIAVVFLLVYSFLHLFRR